MLTLIIFGFQVPHHHELHQDLPQGPEPRPRHRRDQEALGRHRQEGRARTQRNRHHHPGFQLNKPAPVIRNRGGLLRSRLRMTELARERNNAEQKDVLFDGAKCNLKLYFKQKTEEKSLKIILDF